MKTLGIMLNSEIMAPTQYDGFNFKGLCVFEGVVLGCGESGIFQVSGDTDNGTDIEAFFQVPSTDLGVVRPKKLRSLVLSGYVNGNLAVTVILGNDEKTEYTMDQIASIDTRDVKVDLNSDDVGRYVGLKVENINGADFSIDTLDLIVLALTREPRVSNNLMRTKSVAPVFAAESVLTVG